MKINDLNHYMNTRKINKNLQKRIRKYMIYTLEEEQKGFIN